MKNNILDTKTFVVQNYKFFVIGKMFGMVTHQFNQPLTVLTYTLSQLQFFYQNKMLTADIFCNDMKRAEDTVASMSQSIYKLNNFLHTKKDMTEMSLTDFFKELEFVSNYILKEFSVEFAQSGTIIADKDTIIVLLLDIIRAIYEVSKIKKMSVQISEDSDKLHFDIDFFDIKVEVTDTIIDAINANLLVANMVIESSFGGSIQINNTSSLSTRVSLDRQIVNFKG